MTGGTFAAGREATARQLARNRLAAYRGRHTIDPVCQHDGTYTCVHDGITVYRIALGPRFQHDAAEVARIERAAEPVADFPR